MDLNALAARVAGKTPDVGSRSPELRLGVSQGPNVADRAGTTRVLLDGTIVPGVASLVGAVPSGIPVWVMQTGGSLLILGMDGGPRATDWTPTLAQGVSTNIAKTVNHASWVRLGDRIHCDVVLTASGTGTSGSQITITLPISGNGIVLPVGTGGYSDGGTLITATAWTVSTTTLRLLRTNATLTGAIGADPAIAVASGDLFYASFSYLAA